MSLSAHDKEALDLIAEGLAASDPRFAAKLSAFTKLTDGGEMPARERIRAATRPTAFRGPLMRGSRPGGRTRPRRPLYWITVAVWLLISATMISLALILSHSGAPACARGQGTGCANRSVPAAPSRSVPSAPSVPADQNGQEGTGFLGP
ncbi:MAG TPA: DUF3040 domain-containing protein [Trebonia sp.]